MIETDPLKRWRDLFVAGLLFWAEHHAQQDALSSSGGAAIEGDLERFIHQLLPRFGNSRVDFIEGIATIADAASASPAVLLAAAIAGAPTVLTGDLHGSPRVRFDVLNIEPDGRDIAHVHYACRVADRWPVESAVLTVARAESTWLFRGGELRLPTVVLFVLCAAADDDD